MSLLDRIKSDQLQARVSRATNKAGFLTVLLGEAERVSKQANDEQMIKILTKVVKDNTETIRNISDTEAQDKLQFEIDIAKEYLPSQLSADDIRRWLVETYKGDKNKGQMMAWLKQHHAGRYDGKVAAQVVDSLI